MAYNAQHNHPPLPAVLLLTIPLYSCILTGLECSPHIPFPLSSEPTHVLHLFIQQLSPGHHTLTWMMVSKSHWACKPHMCLFRGRLTLFFYHQLRNPKRMVIGEMESSQHKKEGKNKRKQDKPWNEGERRQAKGTLLKRRYNPDGRTQPHLC